MSRGRLALRFASSKIVSLQFDDNAASAIQGLLCIGCASLPGIESRKLSLSLSFLHHHALMSEERRVRSFKWRGVDMAVLNGAATVPRKGGASLPPLLKAYLRAGAKFGDGAVIDTRFRTIGVFTITPLAELEERNISY